MTFRFALRRGLLCAVLAAPALPASGEPLQPWQLVRSLQLVQDRIADGDQAALPMQRKLLEMIDAQLRAATPTELAEPRNWDAVMVYAMGGGNPATVKALMPDLLAAAEATAAKTEAEASDGEGKSAEPAEHDAEGHAAKAEPAAEGHEADAQGEAAEHGAEKKKSGHGEAKSEKGHGEGDKAEEAQAETSPQDRMHDLALGVFNYGRGRADYAEQALAKIDPLRERPELGAFVALIKGSLEAKSNPAGALKLFDQARLMAPGTLVEEAALRRSVMLAVQLKDRARFLLASGQYVRRFLRSPYASQFADAFVSGVTALGDGLDLDTVAAITADMAPEQERVVYLRIARQAGIDNRMALSAFASAKAGTEPQEVAAAAQDPRTALYTALSGVTSENTADTLAQLDALDKRRLTAGDRELLDAVKAVAVATIREPAPLRADAPAPRAATGTGDETKGPEQATPSLDQTRPGIPLPLGKAGPSPTEAGGALPAGADAGEAALAKKAAFPEADAIDARMAETRKSLADVDRLLQEPGK